MFLILLKNEPTSRIKCVGVTTKIIFILLRLAIIGGMIGLTVWAIRNILPIAWNMNKVNVWDDEAGIAVSSCSKFNAVFCALVFSCLWSLVSRGFPASNEARTAVRMASVPAPRYEGMA